MRPQHLSEQQKTAALVMYILAAWTWNPGPEHDDDEERWTTHCMNHSAYEKRAYESAVWWALRYENSPTQRSKDADDWLGYLEHVCANNGLLRR